MIPYISNKPFYEQVILPIKESTLVLVQYRKRYHEGEFDIH
jgi:hypothetical protein